MRLITGLLVAIGVVWLAFPLLDQFARSAVYDIDRKLERIADKQRRVSSQLEDAYEQLRNLRP